MTTRLLPWMTTAAFAALIPWVAGLSGLAYAPILAAGRGAGGALGRSLAGGHAFGWVAGLAIGYTTSCLVVWALIALGAMSGMTLAGAWALEAVGTLAGVAPDSWPRARPAAVDAA